MSKQIVLAINGGHMYPSHKEFLESLKTREIDLGRMKPHNDWKFHLQRELGDDYDVLVPRMPTSDDAQYDEWKLWFERIMEMIDAPVILVGHSLGAMFLSKYLSETELGQPVRALYLVAGRYDAPDSLYPDTSFTITRDLAVLTQRAERVVFFHSTDDPVVAFESFVVYKKLVPDAIFVEFHDRGHFLDESFPELITDIRALEC